ncbi:MAG TPA: IS110 family transposase [Terriglobales bacterium]|nr:IS110 family transposase [Terriglobales bacterium]
MIAAFKPTGKRNGGETVEMAIYVGIDVHKHYCQAALMSEQGRVTHELRFDNNSTGATNLINLAKSVDPHIKAVVEPSANFWIRIYDQLESEGMDVKLSNPLRTKAIAEARIKTDRIDAKTLAYLLRGDLVAESYVPTRKNRERRALIRHRTSLIQMRVDIKNRIHALLDKHELSHNYTDLFGKQSLEWLHSLQLPTTDQQILQSSLRIVETLSEQIRDMDIQIAKDATSEEKAKLLMTMPGVDYYAAMILLSEIGDVHRFSSDEKLVSWVGLAPQVHQSGETSWTGHISRKGSKRARWILGQCAQSARQHDPRMREFYERIERKHGSQKAVVAVARKMLAIMYVMLIRNEPYRGENPDLTERKHKRLNTLANSA